VKSLGKFPDRFFAEIAGQRGAVRRAAAALAEQRGEVARLRAAMRRATAIVFTGMGGSYDECYVPVAALARRGVASQMILSSELLHFRLPALPAGALLACVSQSGESAEVVAVVERLRREGRAAAAHAGRGDVGLVDGPVWESDGAREGVLIASVTNGLDNTLARAAASKVTRRE
jgi:glucosamine 6-phosphate synthetase-like amidotransferase/phosphosugar isomerase protein